MKNKFLITDNKMEIEHPPALISLNLYLEKLEKLNSQERKIFPEILKEIVQSQRLITLKHDINPDNIDKLIKRFNQ